MTVCIAAICHANYTNGPYIVGASDRMLTVGETIEYEPYLRKISTIGSNIAILVAGDMTVHSTVLAAVRREAEAMQRPSIEQVAELYAAKFREYRRMRAERAVLQPLALTSESFLSRQHEFTSDFVEGVAKTLVQNELEAMAIIAGIDGTGAHLFLVDDPGQVQCFDASGFVAIGIGAEHAQSQLMLERYGRHWSFSEAFFALYSAKVRGEAAPGIGKQTDMFYIGPHNASFIADNEMDEIVKIFERKQARDANSKSIADQETVVFIKNLNKSPRQSADKEGNDAEGSEGQGRQSGDDSSFDGDSSADAAEASQRDEDQQAERKTKDEGSQT
jgi:20S proteasome alpha/beta subunit